MSLPIAHHCAHLIRVRSSLESCDLLRRLHRNVCAFLSPEGVNDGPSPAPQSSGPFIPNYWHARERLEHWPLHAIRWHHKTSTRQPTSRRCFANNEKYGDAVTDSAEVSLRHRKRGYDRSVFRSIHTQFFFRSDLETAKSGIERLEDTRKACRSGSIWPRPRRLQSGMLNRRHSP